ncbi:hypothetical protein SHM_04680 [Spiroplasma ixodetis]|uniref:Uncharacterized protein n=1 Tax=Spiroplasma ixodetis TaxID=2141 RepID=A0ABN6T177_9MOLU|nr:hypothetical protein SHM_04680 [Spiroplasma ixodetis]
MQDIVFQFEKYYWTHSISLFPPQVHVGRSSINNWKNPIQEHKNKLEEIYQNFLKSQELSKVLFNKSINTYKPHFINKMKREVLFIKINEEKKI